MEAGPFSVLHSMVSDENQITKKEKEAEDNGKVTNAPSTSARKSTRNRKKTNEELIQHRDDPEYIGDKEIDDIMKHFDDDTTSKKKPHVKKERRVSVM